MSSSMTDQEEVTLTWKAAMAQGAIQRNRLDHGDRTDSPNKTLADMESPEGTAEGEGNGWTVQEYTDYPPVPEGYETVYETLGISEDDEGNHHRFATQDQKFKNSSGKNREPTKGTFHTKMNVHSGTIVALSGFSSAHLIGKSDTEWKNKLPKVSRMSDVLWCQWVEVAKMDQTPEKVSQLKYVFKHDVSTPDTKFIVERAAALVENDNNMGKDEFECEWPGHKFQKDDKQFTALLGTIHGRSMVDLIVTHRSKLPNKSIASVTIFTTEGDEEAGEVYHILWTLTE